MIINADPNARRATVRRLTSILCLVVVIAATPGDAASARCSQQRRPTPARRARARGGVEPTSGRASSPPVPTPVIEGATAPAADSVATHDLSVEVVRRERLLINGTVPVLEITNRERRSVSIRRILINDEWEPTERFLQRGKIVKLPATLELGDVLSTNIWRYDRAPVYITLETDAGSITLKLGR